MLIFKKVTSHVIRCHQVSSLEEKTREKMRWKDMKNGCPSREKAIAAITDTKKRKNRKKMNQDAELDGKKKIHAEQRELKSLIFL